LHHKVIIIDDRTVLAGSFNFSANAANDNDENLLVIESQTIASGFSQEFDAILAVARNPVR
jgi:phosphatidylserine/phosphatidylglycerophosphate/cardiolipin synthase-like enzyme